MTEAPQPTPERRRLVRRPDQAMLGGVAAGVADYFDLDPLFVRIGFVVLSLAGGAGVPLYLAGWLLIPAAGEPASIAEDLIGQFSRG
jgi:phage shock protein PspC (stress-responsive transcriptional regulator)